MAAPLVRREKDVPSAIRAHGLVDGIGVLTAVVDTGSFVRAGKQLGMTQSGVSRAIARLEERVGIRLVQRAARAVVLTEDGRRFYDRVKPLVAGLEEAADEAAGASASPRGHLRVAVNGLVARTLIGPRINRFLEGNPEITLDLAVRERVGDLVGDGFDAAVLFGELEPSALIARKLLETRVVTCASRAYLEKHGAPKHPRELAKHACIRFRDPRSGRPFEWIFQHGNETIRPKIGGRLVVDDSATHLAACMGGWGIGQKLELELRAVPNHGLTVLFSAWPDETFPLYVYYPSRLMPPARVRAFVDFVVSAAR